jgi:dipeptide transport system substrate-binding protein
VKDHPFAPDKAKAMPKAAGVTAPLDLDLWHMPVQRQGSRHDRFSE